MHVAGRGRHRVGPVLGERPGRHRFVTAEASGRPDERHRLRHPVPWPGRPAGWSQRFFAPRHLRSTFTPLRLDRLSHRFDSAVNTARPGPSGPFRERTLMSTFAELGVPARPRHRAQQPRATAPVPHPARHYPRPARGSGRLGRVSTGSGKTLAFGVPLAARVGEGGPRRPRPRPRPHAEAGGADPSELAPVSDGRRSLVVTAAWLGAQRNGRRGSTSWWPAPVVSRT